MAKEIGQLNVKIGLDATGFQNGISNLNREMRKVQSEFRLASTEMGKHGSELEKLKLRSDSLTKQTDLQRQKVQALEAAHQKPVETKGKDAKATQDLEIKLNQAKAQLVRMEQDLKGINQEIDKQSSGWYKLSRRLEPIGTPLLSPGRRVTRFDAGKVVFPALSSAASISRQDMSFVLPFESRQSHISQSMIDSLVRPLSWFAAISWRIKSMRFSVISGLLYVPMHFIFYTDIERPVFYFKKKAFASILSPKYF